jgi:S-formylglutathione hydrolase
LALAKRSELRFHQVTFAKGFSMEIKSENACFGGTQGVYAHASDSCGGEMTFGLFLPEEAKRGPVPVLWYLSGLTCTHENAMTESGCAGLGGARGDCLGVS